MLKVPAANR